MSKTASSYRGCMLGMAIGDAMGYTVDNKSWEDICESYGPNGLLGYDLQGDYAEVTSYTQTAAYVANGLLLALTRGRQDIYLKYVTMAMKEWYRRQHFPRDPEKPHCWVAQLPELRRRCCRDAWMQDALRFDTLGTPEKPINRATTSGGLTGAAMLGVFYDPQRMDISQLGTLAVQTVALTHGNPETFLTGAVLAHLMASVMQNPKGDLQAQVLEAAHRVEIQYGIRYSQATQIAGLMEKAVELSKDLDMTALVAMTMLECTTAAQCLAGAVYTCLIHINNFDEAMIAAVNHSGRSAAVGAIVGMILGARMGEEALPEFYVESLDVLEPLRQLGDDLFKGTPTTSLFDDDWDHKYVQGLPIQR